MGKETGNPALKVLMYTEVAARELDSKLLLAVVAASRGHTAVVSDKPTLRSGIRMNLFRGAIFHTKSVTPDQFKISFHRQILGKGLHLTSQDEEAGLEHEGFETFARRRFARESVEQLSALFCWGPEDFDFLVGKYPEYRDRIHLVGSPRADLWGERFANAAITPQRFGLNGYLLVSSNFGVPAKPFGEIFRGHLNAGYYSRDPGMLNERLQRFSGKFALIPSFIQALIRVGEVFPTLQVVFRPHPTESISLWEIFLKDLPNVRVIREGSSADWIHRSKALIHSGCTTAFEGRLAGKPVISFEPVEGDYGLAAKALGVRTRTVDELIATLQTLEAGSELVASDAAVTAESLLERKIFTSEQSFAAERIVDVWEVVVGEHDNKAFPFLRFWWFTALNRWQDFLRKLLRRVLRQKKDEKFPAQDFALLIEKVRGIEAVLGLEKGVTVRRMHDRCFVVSRRK